MFRVSPRIKLVLGFVLSPISDRDAVMTMSIAGCHIAVYEWLKACSYEQAEPPRVLSLQPRLLTPPTSISTVRRKRKRDMSTSTSRSPQKRQRSIRDDDVFPEQSASGVGVTELSERTRLSQPSHHVPIGSSKHPNHCIGYRQRTIGARA
jgi:hypothetical protein